MICFGGDSSPFGAVYMLGSGGPQVRFKLPVSAIASTALRRDATSCRRGRESSPSLNTKKPIYLGVDGLFGTPDGIRTRDLRRERAMS